MVQRTQITEDLVRRTVATGKTYFIRDVKPVGFALRVTEAGAKSFIVEARVNGKPCRFTIAPADRTTVQEARREAKTLLARHPAGRARTL
jgi:Arm DNA-binding domain